MNSTRNKNLFIVWNPFQRRAQTLARMLDLDVRYYHFRWEERGKIFKAISYVGKLVATLKELFRSRPKFVFIQLAPTPLLYIAALYCALTDCRYISDCHNTMIYDAAWIKWPFAKLLLRRSFILLVHNEDVKKRAQAIGLEPDILRDPLPIISVPTDIEEVAGISIKQQPYVIIPCGMAVDEPVEELFTAAGAMPETLFVLTWFADRLPAHLRDKAPQNIRFTGFLEEPYFNALYANARAALVLTTREGTQPSGAAEAISLGVPLVISDIATTRRLYKDAPVFVKNDPVFISKGIRFALESYSELAERVSSLRRDLEREANDQIISIKDSLKSVST